MLGLDIEPGIEPELAIRSGLPEENSSEEVSADWQVNYFVGWKPCSE